MEVFLASFATEDYDAMASALSEMGATGNDINIDEFAKDLRKIFSSIQVMFSNNSRLFNNLKAGSTFFRIKGLGEIMNHLLSDLYQPLLC
jgi:predicted unusual protein kinase regulating ubiquinone biosynthesis (AarF/ABC1/UbiB family)